MAKGGYRNNRKLPTPGIVIRTYKRMLSPTTIYVFGTGMKDTMRASPGGDNRNERWKAVHKKHSTALRHT